jgi:GNAT superfamily N-acetyltransferase
MADAMTDVSTSLAIEPLYVGHGADADALIALYRQAIPARERKHDDVIRGMASSPDHRLAVAKQGGELVGFFVLFRGERLALLEYMAVADARRGAGLGAALYRAARTAAGARPLLIEVESDRGAVPDLAVRRKRLAFYRKLGCRRVDGLDYLLPLPGEGAPPTMDLLVDGAGDAVPPATVAAWLREVYAGVYGCGGDDRRLRTMIASLPPVVRLIP